MHGLLILLLYLGSTKSLIDHEVLTACACVYVLMFMSLYELKSGFNRERLNKQKLFVDSVGRINCYNFKNDPAFPAFFGYHYHQIWWYIQIFITEIDWLTLLKCRATGLSQLRIANYNPVCLWDREWVCSPADHWNANELHLQPYS